MLYTIGHSNHAIEKFIGLLRQHGIKTLCDVRTHPFSRFSPQHSQKLLKASMADAGIDYIFLGKELGGRSNNPACYRDGVVQYELLAEQPCFTEGIKNLMQEMGHHCTTVMCAERDPIQCHRALLVAQSIFESGTPVNHIHPDGSLETHEEMKSRQMGKNKPPQNSLF